MPEFELPDVVSGKKISSKDFETNQPILIIFMCRHCPYVSHVAEELAKLSQEYESRVAIVGISANDVENYPDDSPENLAKMVEEYDFRFPILYDESQEVAKDFTAACTPDFFLFNKNKELVYRGQLDESRPGNNKPVTGKDLRAAIDAVLGGKKPEAKQYPSSGCNIKWK